MIYRGGTASLLRRANQGGFHQCRTLQGLTEYILNSYDGYGEHHEDDDIFDKESENVY